MTNTTDLIADLRAIRQLPAQAAARELEYLTARVAELEANNRALAETAGARITELDRVVKAVRTALGELENSYLHGDHKSHVNARAACIDRIREALQ